MAKSYRASVLNEVLGFINRDDWLYEDGFIVFGREAYEQRLSGQSDEAVTFDDITEVIANKAHIDHGNKLISDRTSLRAQPKSTFAMDFAKAFEGLPEHQQEAFRQAIREGLPNLLNRSESEIKRSDADAIDAALADRFIKSLSEASERLSTFDTIDIVPETVQHPEYFDEAHICDIYGQKIATAVLCRAVLEAGLAQRVDASEKIKFSLKPKQSYIEKMLEEAISLGVLDKSRLSYGILIRDAGNKAIHKPDHFSKSYAHRMKEIVDKLRVIMADLFRSSK